MEIKKTEQVLALCYSKRTSLRNIHDIGNREVPKLYEAAAKMKLHEVGPMQFIYKGIESDDPDAEFDLEICMIVDEKKENSGNYYFRGIDSIKCSSMIYKGSTFDMGEKGYQKIIPETISKGYKLTKECREVYHKYIDPTNSENITEIQIGIN